MENIKLETTGKKPTDDEIEGQILLAIGEKSFTLYHSENYDTVQVYLILAAALEHVAKMAEYQVEQEAKYLQ